MRDELIKIAKNQLGYTSDFTCISISGSLGFEVRAAYADLYQLENHELFMSLDNARELWKSEDLQLRRQLMVLFFAETKGDLW